MSNANRQRFLLSNFCCCCTVETGSKIIGYIGAIGAAIEIIVGIVALILLSVAYSRSNTVTVSGVNTGNNNNNNNNNNDTVNVDNSQVVGAFVLTVLAILVCVAFLIVNVVLLIGLNKKRPSYLKLYLVVASVSLVCGLIISIINIITVFSFYSFVSFMYMLLPLYFLLVIRTAYYNMLDADTSRPNIIYAPAPAQAEALPPKPDDNVA